ncbi:MAG: hypothetical protein WCI93_00420 [bacterium]
MEKKYLKIEGDAVHLVTERIERTVLLDDFLGEIQKERGFISPILPQGCRMFHQSGTRTTFVVEQNPQVRQLTWRKMDNGDAWKLAFPYVVFLISFSCDAIDTGATRIFYRTSPLGNGDEKLQRSNLCNVYQDGHACTGDMRVSGATLAQKAESFVTEFWKSNFNSDLSDNNFNPAANRFPQVKNLSAWQAESMKNPLFPLGIQWFEAGQLADFLPKGGRS